MTSEYPCMFILVYPTLTPIFLAWCIDIFKHSFLFFIYIFLLFQEMRCCHMWLWLFIMLSLSVQYIIFLECFQLCIALQVFIGTFLITDKKVLQAFLYHHQTYFLLLVSNLIFHLWLEASYFTKTFISSWNFISCKLSTCLHHLKFSCFWWHDLFNAILLN